MKDTAYTEQPRFAGRIAKPTDPQGTTLEPALRSSPVVSNRAKTCAGAKAASCPEDLGPGLGWDLLRFGDQTILWHTGSDSGEFTFAYNSPAKKRGAVILTNSAVGFLVVLDILQHLEADLEFMKFLRAQAGGG